MAASSVLVAIFGCLVILSASCILSRKLGGRKNCHLNPCRCCTSDDFTAQQHELITMRHAAQMESDRANRLENYILQQNHPSPTTILVTAAPGMTQSPSMTTFVSPLVQAPQKAFAVPAPYVESLPRQSNPAEQSHQKSAFLPPYTEWPDYT